MKNLRFILSACLLLLISPAFAQDANVVEKAIHSLNIHELGIRFAINVVAVFILVRLIYFNRHRNKDFLFTLTLFNSVNFLLCFLLSGANLEVGFAFGLFAIFSIMRYRTVTVPVKEMGYLFLCVAMGLINSLATSQDNYVVLIGSNAFVLFLAMIMDSKATPAISPQNDSKQIIYERIDLIKPEMMDEMIADLRNRTGLPICSVEILSIDLMQDVAVIKANYTRDVNDNIVSINKNDFSVNGKAPEKLISAGTNHV